MIPGGGRGVDGVGISPARAGAQRVNTKTEALKIFRIVLSFMELLIGLAVASLARGGGLFVPAEFSARA
jgi:hypothetical protein